MFETMSLSGYKQSKYFSKAQLNLKNTQNNNKQNLLHDTSLIYLGKQIEYQWAHTYVGWQIVGCWDQIRNSLIFNYWISWKEEWHLECNYSQRGE